MERQSAPELRARQPFSAAKFAAEGGRSGPGVEKVKRWRRTELLKRLITLFIPAMVI